MEVNKTARLQNIRMLQFMAEKLGPLCDDIVFVGGCTTALFITDEASPDVRYTFDVDCIVDVISSSDYYKLGKKLSQRGFKQSIQEENICRWTFNDAILDLVPIDEKILGFSNRWYKFAIKNSITYKLPSNTSIRTLTAPYFLATKLEAFKTRGKMDFLASHDFEDIVSVVDGREALVKEVNSSDSNLKNYLIEYFQYFQDSRSFHDALPGHFVQYGNLADDRIEFFLDKIKKIAE